MLKSSLIIGVLLITFGGYAQEEEYVYGDKPSKKEYTSKSKGFDWQRTTIGGGFYAAFGNNSYFLIAPTLGYYLTENFMAGVGLNYAYEKVTSGTSFPYKSNTYGGSIFGQYKFRDLPFLAHAELELVTINVDFKTEFIEDFTLNLVNPYVGGGLKQQMGNYSFFYALILFNLNETRETNIVQQNPVIRIGISVGL